MNEEYNGWTNRETWATNLWLDNERGLYEQVQDLAREEIEGHDEGEEINPYFLGEKIKAIFEELFDFTQYNYLSKELLSMRDDIGSLWRVNWREIADYQLEAMKESASN